MRKFLRNLAVKIKLLYSFLLLASFILILGLSALFIQKSLEKNQAKTLSEINISDAFFEAKYFMRSDMHIFTELMAAEDKNVFDYWWGEHEFQVLFFNDQLKKIEVELNKSLGFNNENLISEILSGNDEIRAKYNEQLIPLFNTLKQLKSDELELNKQLSYADTNLSILNLQKEINDHLLKYKQLNNQVSAHGLAIITQLDTGKDLVRIEISTIIDQGQNLLQRTFKVFGIITFIGLTFSIFVSIYISRLISRPVKQILTHVNKLGLGIQPEPFVIKFQDEFGKIQESLNNLTGGLTKTSGFAKEIGEGNFESDYTPMSNDDVLGNSLINMRDSLHKSRQEEDNRRKEDEQRNWTATGLTKFGDIMRQSSDNLENLGYQLMSNLIDYVGAVQGALFVINEENENDVHFELVNAIAYERKKYMHKKIKIGEGLIGRTAYEQKTIYLKEIPQDYVNITSGLGTANPNNILLVPVQIDNKVNGVIELVLFSELKDYQIKFIERVAENIASFLTTIRINEKTAELLKDSQLKSEELSAQEEEMRQNLEELQATQEEAARRESEANQLWASLGKLQGILECDLNGNIQNLNDKASQLLSIDHDTLLGKSYQDIFFEHDTSEIDQTLESVLTGQVNNFTKEWGKQDKNIRLLHQLTLVNDVDGIPLKILIVLQQV